MSVPTCHKKTIVEDIKLTAEPPSYVGRYCRTIEERAADLRSWVKDFHEFIRDHRSQDAVTLSVELVKKDVCSNCGEEWDIVSDKDGTYCGNCGAIPETVISAVKEDSHGNE